MQTKYLIMAVAIALLLVAVGCSKLKQSSEVPVRPDQVALGDASEGVYGGIYELNSLEEDVQVEDVDVNPDELSGLDF